MTTVVLDHVEVRLTVEQIISAMRQLSAEERARIKQAVGTELFASGERPLSLQQLERLRQLEEQQLAGYERYPVTKEEFEEWLPEQAWGDE